MMTPGCCYVETSDNRVFTARCKFSVRRQTLPAFCCCNITSPQNVCVYDLRRRALLLDAAEFVAVNTAPCSCSVSRTISCSDVRAL